MTDSELVFILTVIYLFIAFSIARIGSSRACGGKKSMLVSLIFTPVTGLFYTLSFKPKDTLKITHFRCSECGLEYTTYHRYCPTCNKDNKKVKLTRISMRTY
jgi:hypothetical protein